MADVTNVVIEQDVVTVQIIEQQTTLVSSADNITIELSEQYTPPVSNGSNGRVDKTVCFPITASLSIVELLPANTMRNGVIIHNNSSANCYVRYGNDVGLLNYSYQIGSKQTLEMSPYLYTGVITAVWDNADGFAMVTEL